jgi:hypothetical protein
MGGVEVEGEMGWDVRPRRPQTLGPIRSRGPELSNNANKHRHLTAMAGARLR